ncbi:MAG: hypothetical protein WDW38_011335 [Sanguina aurantia]
MPSPADSRPSSAQSVQQQPSQQQQQQQQPLLQQQQQQQQQWVSNSSSASSNANATTGSPDPVRAASIPDLKSTSLPPSTSRLLTALLPAPPAAPSSALFLHQHYTNRRVSPAPPLSLPDLHASSPNNSESHQINIINSHQSSILIPDPTDGERRSVQLASSCPPGCPNANGGLMRQLSRSFEGCDLWVAPASVRRHTSTGETVSERPPTLFTAFGSLYIPPTPSASSVSSLAECHLFSQEVDRVGSGGCLAQPLADQTFPPACHHEVLQSTYSSPLPASAGGFLSTCKSLLFSFELQQPTHAVPQQLVNSMSLPALPQPSPPPLSLPPSSPLPPPLPPAPPAPMPLPAYMTAGTKNRTSSFGPPLDRNEISADSFVGNEFHKQPEQQQRRPAVSLTIPDVVIPETQQSPGWGAMMKQQSHGSMGPRQAGVGHVVMTRGYVMTRNMGGSNESSPMSLARSWAGSAMSSPDVLGNGGKEGERSHDFIARMSTLVGSGPAAAVPPAVRVSGNGKEAAGVPGSTIPHAQAVRVAKVDAEGVELEELGDAILSGVTHAQTNSMMHPAMPAQRKDNSKQWFHSEPAASLTHAQLTAAIASRYGVPHERATHVEPLHRNQSNEQSLAKIKEGAGTGQQSEEAVQAGQQLSSAWDRTSLQETVLLRHPTFAHSAVNPMRFKPKKGVWAGKVVDAGHGLSPTWSGAAAPQSMSPQTAPDNLNAIGNWAQARRRVESRESMEPMQPSPAWDWDQGAQREVIHAQSTPRRPPGAGRNAFVTSQSLHPVWDGGKDVHSMGTNSTTRAQPSVRPTNGDDEVWKGRLGAAWGGGNIHSADNTLRLGDGGGSGSGQLESGTDASGTPRAGAGEGWSGSNIHSASTTQWLGDGGGGSGRLESVTEGAVSAGPGNGWGGSDIHDGDGELRLDAAGGVSGRLEPSTAGGFAMGPRKGWGG